MATTEQISPPAAEGALQQLPASPRRSLFRLPRILKNRKAAAGIVILLFFVVVAIFADQIAPTKNAARIVARGSLAPLVDQKYPLGTSKQGQDIFAQVVHGARTSLIVGFLTGTLIIAISIAIGVTSGYVGGWVDDVLSLITNIFLILPGLPLIIVVSGWLERPGPVTVVLVLSFTSWAYAARVLRSQTLTLRNSEFVASARVVGEPGWRIVIHEILPNMTSLVVSAWIGAVLLAILSEAALEFIGLGDANAVTWGTTLYWAQNNQALLTGAWWTFIPPGVCIALVGFSLTLINYGIDEVTNPRLRTEGASGKITAATTVARRAKIAQRAEGSAT
jgi:peptide/nickel transport system permease protein